MRSTYWLLPVLTLLACQPAIEPPVAIEPVPEQKQLDWQDLEFYAFVHFNMNTFTNMEWGFGDESPELFNPTELDCRQWAKVCKDAGMTGIILTAKHHDGFCLWPSEYTEHSVKNSPWKDGQGDVMRELADACEEYGLKLGVYLSPWDRNHADYGKPEYLTYFRNQLRELLTDYGDVYEVWFDGANGGTGYYGGANEERRVDKQAYYDWQNTYPIIRELQPDAVIFSDAGPDVRWVGNEDGHAFRTMWSNLMRDSVYPGMPEYSRKYASGQVDGTHWVPGETNVSIRPGWYYHEYEDHKVRSLPQLVDMYYESIGRNTTWLLNFPVDKRGLIHENDVAQLEKLTEVIKADFAEELAKGNTISASNERGGDYTAAEALDEDPKSYWAAEDGVTEASLTINFDEAVTFNRLLVQENIALGQRVKAFTLEAEMDGSWQEIASETTIGCKRILRLPETTATAVRLNITDAKACPTIANIELYHAPKLLLPPTVVRNKAGELQLQVPEEGVSLYYTLDGTEPGTSATAYTSPVPLPGPATVKAVAVDENTGRTSEVSQVELDVAPTNWKVLNAGTEAEKAIDGLEESWWGSKKEDPVNELTIDLGETLTLRGFTYLPVQSRYFSGLISNYELYTSTDNRNWTQAAAGEFSNIQNSPIWQRVTFEAQPARYIRLKSVATVDGNPPAFAEVGVLTESSAN
ncbi:alpha-L-fucosidase [Flavilitoribacter nigricans]|uniref:alpha-L-fucosidase n=1 Tax=Flavilitoribacter nigricans (strain ATCC 23147 / DSM 23189 / NBRC 102662 / NCIMB 1420 / SS-2) TaxID=1122177 RepID=A0A2D0N687_FLAN2|nr:alpha-L-fucosidase [Flavilitoribacter nigricans]PHN03293.1 alpha-L-fucosidase [Flavilitoribacter nigricans DSM 23189 = NBRC 102662]